MVELTTQTSMIMIGLSILSFAVGYFISYTLAKRKQNMGRNVRAARESLRKIYGGYVKELHTIVTKIDKMLELLEENN